VISKPQPSRPQGGTSAAAAAGPAGGAPSNLPAGFFDDKATDQRARGILPPKPEEVEKDFAAFQREIEQELEDQARRAHEEATAEVAEREEKEEYENL
jgi:hypothetical protein